MSTQALTYHPAFKRAMNQLSSSSAQVISMRLAMLPFQWMTDPKGAEQETKKMFSEKHNALLESQVAFVMLPVAIWTDFLNTGLFSTPQQILSRASTVATRSMFKPAQSRVTSNVKRLGKGVASRK